MKKLILAGFAVLFSIVFLSTQLVRAQTGSMMGGSASETSETETHIESIETVLQQILAKQQVSTIQGLNLSKISDDDFERLGDAVMEQQHPGVAHEIMDRMMGGEGSESLRQMHINIGKAYLGYGGYYGAGMMSGGMMGYQGQYRYGILGTLTFTALIVFFSAGTYFFIKQARRK